MYKGKKVTVIIGAAGIGSRMGASIPKQFLKIHGRTILELAVEPFENSDYVDNILVVTGQDFVVLCEKILAAYSKVNRVIEGGPQRQDSIGNGVKLLADGELVLIHDGARPYVDQGIIQRVLENAHLIGGAVPVVGCKDTIRQLEEWHDDGCADTKDLWEARSVTLDRSRLYNVQTPQGFRTEIIKEAFAKAATDGFWGTDDASLVERLGKPVGLTEGSHRNIKITTREDLPVETRVGTGYDVHRLVEGRKLILGGVEVPNEMGLLGHSDADVVIHALMDAMLGAAALGDIGRHFPDTDQTYAGISSLKLLGLVKDLIEEAGYCFSNGDITIIAQRPKLAPYICQMEENLVKVLGVEKSQINIKATTTEKLGFAGRGEGIAAEAVCLLRSGVDRM